MNTDITKQALAQSKNLMHPFHGFDMVAHEGPFIIDRAHGMHVYDSEGKGYLDAVGGMWCTQIGTGRKEMADAIAEQVMKCNYSNPFVDNANTAQTALAAKLAELAPGDLNHVFLTCGGSTANEAAFRLVQLYNVYRGKPEKRALICREDAYHGTTLLTSSLGGRAAPNWDESWYLDSDGNNVLDIHKVSSPNYFHHGDGLSEAKFGEKLYQEVVDKIAALGGPDKVAAFLAEPIIGAGGVVPPPANYLKRVWEYCQANDILYWSDEVVTGFGRLGHFFASEAEFGITPDIIISAKGLTSAYAPLGACIFSDKIWNVLAEADQGRIFNMGYTYSGHPISCAAALKNIEIIERENLLEHVREVGPYFMEQLQTLRDLEIVGDVRGSKLMACVEIVKNNKTMEFLGDEINFAVGHMVGDAAQNHGLIVRAVANMSIMSPPLIITKAEVDEVVAKLRKAILEVTDILRTEGHLADEAA